MATEIISFILEAPMFASQACGTARTLSLLPIVTVTAMTSLKFRSPVHSTAPSSKPFSFLELTSSLLLIAIVVAATPAFAWNALNTTTVLSISSNGVTVGTAVAFTATVTDQNGSPVSKGQVLFCDATAIYCEDAAVLGTAQLTSNGTATVNLRLGVGTYKVKAVFSGANADAGSASQQQGLTVSGQVPTATALAVSGQDNSFTFTATVTGGGRVAPTGSVTFADTTWNTTLATAALDPNTFAFAFQMFSSNATGGNNHGSVVAADLNGDGIPDLLDVDWGGTVNVLLGNGDGSFRAGQTYGLGAFSVVACDINHDGNLDLVATSGASGGSVAVMLGRGDGTFQTVQFFVTGYPFGSIAVGDFNGDGDPDLVATDPTNNTVSILLGNGDGTFQTQQTYTTGTYPKDVVVGDFNGDGKADLAVANLNDTVVSILLGNGDGTFQPQRSVTAGEGSVIAAADFNRDGKADLAVLVGGTTVLLLLGNGDGTFQPSQSYSVGQNIYDLAAADFNSDGIADLVTVGVSNNARTAAIFAGKGDGTFKSPQTFSVGANDSSVVSGDFNGDGSTDLILLSYTSNIYSASTSVWLNLGSIQATASPVSLSGVGNHALLASYGGDAIFSVSDSSPVDVTHGISNTLTVSVVPSTTVAVGQSVQLTATLSPNTYNGVTASGVVTFLDGQTQIGQQSMNTSGQAALTTPALTPGNHNFTAMYGGDSTFAPVQGTAAVTAFVTTSTTLNLSSSSVTVGTPIKLTATVTDQNGASVTTGQVTLCDTNASHCQDSAALGIAQLTPTGTASMTLRLGVGVHSVEAIYRGTHLSVGSVSATQNVTVTGQLPSTTSFGITQDSKLNTLFTATVIGASGVPPTGSVSFLDTTNENLTVTTASLDSTTAVMFPANTYNILGLSGKPAVADFNHDGKPDLAMFYTYYVNNAVGVLLGNGDGTFQAPTQSFPVGGSPQALAVGDFNSDGNPDIVVINAISVGAPVNGTISVLLGNGDGTFQPQQTFATGQGPCALATSDLNGDGKLDVVVINCFENSIGVLLGNGDGTFQPQQTLKAGKQLGSLVVADFNGDGVPDLAVTNYGDNTVGILLGNGDGTFQAQSTLATGYGPYSLVTGDFNGDGKPDLVVVTYAIYSPYYFGVFLGNGDGTFQPPQTFNFGVAPFAVGDVNGDGKLDLVVTTGTGIGIMPGNGDGTFQPAQFYPANSPGAISVVDLNGDSKPDLLIIDFWSHINVFLNAWSVQASTPAASVPGQGEPHAVVAAYGGDSVYPPSSSSPVNVTSSAMALSALSPASAFVGNASFTLNVSGANYDSGAVVQWNGSPLVTTFASSSQLMATVPPSLSDVAGSPNITVVFGQAASNPFTFSVVAPFGVTSAPATITVAAPGSQASAAITTTPATGFSGTVSFSCTVAYNGQGSPHDAPICSVTPAQVSVASPNTASTTLSISSTAPHTSLLLPNTGADRWVALTSSSCLGFGIVLAGIPWSRPPRRRLFRNVGLSVLLMVACFGLLMLPACGGGVNGGGSTGTNDPGTTAGSYTVTINATAGSYTSTITVPVAVQ